MLAVANATARHHQLNPQLGGSQLPYGGSEHQQQKANANINIHQPNSQQIRTASMTPANLVSSMAAAGIGAAISAGGSSVFLSPLLR
jgi:hypothetical protein